MYEMPQPRQFAHSELETSPNCVGFARVVVDGGELTNLWEEGPPAFFVSVESKGVEGVRKPFRMNTCEVACKC